MSASIRARPSAVTRFGKGEISRSGSSSDAVVVAFLGEGLAHATESRRVRRPQPNSLPRPCRELDAIADDRRTWCNPDQVSLSRVPVPGASGLDGKRILLIVGGGIAAYKSLELIRLLAKDGIAARVILTKAGAEFVTPLSLRLAVGRQGLSGPVQPHRRSRDGPYRAVALGRSRRRLRPPPPT